MKQPNEIISEESIELLRHHGWVLVRKGAIGEAQREARGDADEAWEEAEKWRKIAFNRGELLDEIGTEHWLPAADRIAARHPPREEDNEPTASYGVRAGY